MTNQATEQRIPKFCDEAAFPRDAIKSEPASERMMTLLPAQWGLTKRELFAAMAMQGMVASTALYASECAKRSVEHADALLAALEKTP